MNTLTNQAKPMNETTQLNSELLSADARGRKHIPVAVFAVIVIHIVLFMVLLIAAGCRSTARAKQSITPAPDSVEQQPSARPAGNPPPANLRREVRRYARKDRAAARHNNSGSKNSE
jgi:hypothetical protein